MVKLIALSKSKDRNVRNVQATFNRNGELVPLRVNEDDRPEVFREVTRLLEGEGVNIVDVARELFNLMSPEAKVEEQISSSYYLSGSLAIRDGYIFFGEQRLEETLANHMMSLLDEENAPKDEKMWRSYVKFLDNLHQNADEDIRKQLFRWMEYENKAGNGFGITEDGCLVGYKGCGGTIIEPMSVFSGNAIVDGVEYNGNIPNRAGSVIQMPRSAVQVDPAVGCSYGLHVGTRDYAVQWAPVLLLVKVNPRDVVSVPYECDSQKMRVCEYTVLKVTDASDEHKMYHPTQSDYDDSGYVLTSDEAYNLLGKGLYIEYDDSESSAEGKLVDVYEDGETNIIVETEHDGHVDIELSRVTYYEDFEHDEDLDNDEDLDVEDDDGFVLTLDDAYELLNRGDVIYVDYHDGKSHEGVVVEVYEARHRDPGVIVKSDKGEYKHIKLYRIEAWSVQGEHEQEEEVNPPKSVFEAEVDAAIEEVFKVLNEGFPSEPSRNTTDKTCCGNEEDCNKDCKLEVFKPIYETPLGTSVVIVYDNNEPELKVFSGKVSGINKNDMEITLTNKDSKHVTISFTRIVSMQKL